MSAQDFALLGGRVRVLIGDCGERLRSLPRESVHCVVTSPPYWQLRKYDDDRAQLGLEPTPKLYVAHIVKIMRQARRVLRPDGTAWLNLGDVYMGGRTGGVGASSITSGRNHAAAAAAAAAAAGFTTKHLRCPGLKEKDLVGIPWRVALALQADGWWLRSDIIWHKPAPLPESVTDRPTRAHEYVFLLTKRADYYYNADAIRTPIADKTRSTYGSVRATRGGQSTDRLEESHANRLGASVPKRTPKMASDGTVLGANRRTVWSIASKGYSGSHTSTFPEALVEPCILAGCPVDGVVLDPFVGSGTTLRVAVRLNRCAIGIEKDPRRIPEIQDRLRGTQIDLRGVA